MALERIVITFRPNGNLRGISSQDFDGNPLPMTPAELTAIIPTINAAAVSRLIVVDDEVAFAKSTFQSIQAALDDTSLDDAATVAAAQAAVDAAKLTLRQRRITELEAQKIAIDDQIAAT